MNNKDRLFAIVNPAAGGGRCGTLAGDVIDRVRRATRERFAGVEVAHTKAAGDGTHLARAAYVEGFRNFLAFGGDGTSYEIVNGIFPQALTDGRASLGFLPLGTGNSFLRDFTSEGVEDTIRALAEGKRRACDLIRASHRQGEVYYINMLNLGFPAEVAELTNRRFKGWGEIGYIAAVFARLGGLRYSAFPYRIADASEWNRRECLFLAFGNSKFTGGKMMIAPLADASDGQIECVHWAPIGRARLVWNFPTLFTGSHIRHPLASRSSATRVEFDLQEPIDTVIDGEVLRLNLEKLEILPGALDAFL